MKKLPEYKLGGIIGTVVGGVGGTFIGQPGLGASVGGAIGSQFDKKPKPEKADPVGVIRRATQGYRYGGTLPSAAVPMKTGAKKFEGGSHEQGGIPIDAQGNPTSPDKAIAEVEGGETMEDDYIFSTKINVPGTNKTFAEAHEDLIKKGASEQAIDRLKRAQERTKQTGKGNMNWQKKGSVIPEMRYGGYAGMAGINDQMMEQPNNAERSGSWIDKALNVAQYVVPSAIRLGAAANMKGTKKASKIPARRVPVRSPVFNNARKELAAGFRANPTQANYANYTRGTNQIAGQESQYRSRMHMANAENASRADIWNARIEGQNIERQARDDAARVMLIDQAITAPITAALQNRRGEKQMVANVVMSANRISDPVDRARTLRSDLRAIGISEERINQILNRIT